MRRSHLSRWWWHHLLLLFLFLVWVLFLPGGQSNRWHKEIVCNKWLWSFRYWHPTFWRGDVCGLESEMGRNRKCHLEDIKSLREKLQKKNRMNTGERQVYRHDIFRRRVPKKKRKKRRWNAFYSSLISGTRLATNSKSAAGLRFSFIFIF